MSKVKVTLLDNGPILIEGAIEMAHTAWTYWLEASPEHHEDRWPRAQSPHQSSIKDQSAREDNCLQFMCTWQS